MVFFMTLEKKQLDSIIAGLNIEKTYTESEVKRMTIEHYKKIGKIRHLC